MKKVRLKKTKHNFKLSSRTSNTASAILAVVGLLLSAPFVMDILLMQHGYAQITLLPFLEIMGLVFGGPMFLMGLVSFGNVSGAGRHTNDVDVARIRFAAEQEMMRKDQ